VKPSNQNVEVTHTAMFNTTVGGVGMENFTYQWRHNGTILYGEIRDTLMITNVMESDSGDYECIVTNEYGDAARPVTVANLLVYGKKLHLFPYKCTANKTERSMLFFYIHRDIPI